MSENIWPIMQEAFNAFSPHYQDDIQAAIQETGFEGGDWFFTYLAYGSDPEPLTAVFVHKLLAYVSMERIQGRLTETAEHGFIKKVDDYEYALTTKGREGIDLFFVKARKSIGQVTPMASAKMDRLALLLERIITATIAAAEPAAKPNMQLSRSTAPDPEANAAIQIDQYLTDLLRYRDDAHIAAWTPLLITGHAWEAFSLIWQGEDVDTLAKLAEHRQNRGFATAVYAEALDDLIKRGWLTEAEGIYQVTAKGKQIREDAENLTNQYFEVGLSALNQAEVEELKDLLLTLKEGLVIPEEEPVPA